MANTFENEDLYGTPRDREYPNANDAESGFYGIGAQEPVHWVDADGVADPHEGTLSPFMYYNMPPMRPQQRRRHSIMPWLVAAMIILLALPILKVVLTVLAVLSFVVVAVLGLGILVLVLTLVVGAFVFAHRMRTLSHRMYM